MRITFTGLALSASLLVTNAAFGSATYPDIVKAKYNLKSLGGLDIECFACHVAATGGAGTATQPWAKKLIARGLMGAAEKTLDPALSALEKEGDPSITLLKAGKNPNGDSEPPAYGCGATIAPRPSPEPLPLAAGALVSVALFLMRRRRAAQG